MPMEGDSGARGPVVNGCLLKTVGAMEVPAYSRSLSELITWPERPWVRLCQISPATLGNCVEGVSLEHGSQWSVEHFFSQWTSGNVWRQFRLL